MAQQSSKKFLMIVIVAAGNYVTDGARMLEVAGTWHTPDLSTNSALGTSLFIYSSLT